MTEKSKLLSTSEFASKTGITPAKVSRMIREGKIEAEKVSGKWMIHPRQLEVKTVTQSSAKQKAAKPSKKKTAPAADKSTPPKKGKPAVKKDAASKTSYSLAEFVNMTYLTEYGVMDWLKKGRLSGKQNAAGEWRIDAANLDAPDIRHLVR